MWSYINNSGSVCDRGSSSSSSYATCKCPSDMMQRLVVKVFVDLQMSELQLLNATITAESDYSYNELIKTEKPSFLLH